VLHRAVRWLEEMQVIARIVPVTERKPDRSKRVVYRIVDPYVGFWHRTIAPLVNAGSLALVDPERLWDDAVEPRIENYMGPVFEQLCREFVSQTDRLPFRPVRVGEWWDASSQNQVDVVALGGKGELLVGECKWGPVTGADLRTLRERSLLVAAEAGGVARIHTALFTARGDADDEVEREAAAGGTLLFTGEDLRTPLRPGNSQ